MRTGLMHKIAFQKRLESSPGLNVPASPSGALTTCLIKKDQELRQYKALVKQLQATLDIATARVQDLTSQNGELSQKYEELLQHAQNSSKEAKELKRTLADIMPSLDQLREYRKMAHLRHAVTVKNWLEKRLARECAVKEKTEAENVELREENSLLSELVDELIYNDGPQNTSGLEEKDTSLGMADYEKVLSNAMGDEEYEK